MRWAYLHQIKKQQQHSKVPKGFAIIATKPLFYAKTIRTRWQLINSEI